MQKINDGQVRDCERNLLDPSDASGGYKRRFSNKIVRLSLGMRCGVDVDRNKVMFYRRDGQSLTMEVGPNAINILQQISREKAGVTVKDIICCSDHFERYCILTLFAQKGCIELRDT